MNAITGIFQNYHKSQLLQAYNFLLQLDNSPPIEQQHYNHNQNRATFLNHPLNQNGIMTKCDNGISKNQPRCYYLSTFLS